MPDDKWEDVKESYVDRLKWLLSLGITSFFDASGSIDDEPVGKGGIDNPPPNLTFHRAQQIYAEQHYGLPRIIMYISYPGPQRLKAFGHHTGYGDDFVRIGPIGENAVDGGFTGPRAWLLPSVSLRGPIAQQRARRGAGVDQPCHELAAIAGDGLT